MNEIISPPSNRRFSFKNITGFVLLLALAVVFAVSGISKIDSIETFEWSLLDLGISSFTLAAILARLLIGLELMIAGFLLFHIFLKPFTYLLTTGLLVVFTIYLLLLLLHQGNEGNCGCFGEWIYMSPLSSIWKNIAMIAATVILYFIYPGRAYKHMPIVALLVALTALTTPFVVYPMNIGDKPLVLEESIDLDPLYRSDIPNNPDRELRQGKHVIAFMSLGCPHCRKAAFLLQIIHRQHPDIPVYMVIAGPPELEEDFFKETNARDVPHLRFREPEDFIQMAGPSLPAIYWINNGVIERKANYFQLDPVVIREWLEEN